MVRPFIYLPISLSVSTILQAYNINVLKSNITYHSCLLIDTGHVYPGLKPYTWWIVRIIRATEKFQLVDTSFMNSLMCRINRQNKFSSPKIRSRWDANNRKRMLNYKKTQSQQGVNRERYTSIDQDSSKYQKLNNKSGHA